MSYTKNIASNLVTRIIKIILGFGISIIVARALGPEGKGYVHYLILIFGLVGSYGHFGINNATTYFYKKSKYDIEDIYQTNLSYLILVWIFISIIFMFLKYTGLIMNDYSWLLLFEGLIFIIFNFIQISIRGIYVGDEKIIDINNFFLINNLFLFVTLVITWYCGFLTATLYYTFKVLGMVINAILFLENNECEFKFRINKLLLKQELKYGVIIYSASLLGYMMYRLDQFMIKSILGASDLGVYSVAVILAELVLLVPQSVTTALSGKLYNTKENSRKLITVITTKYTFYISLIIAIIGFFMTPFITIIYGVEFSNSSTPFVILLIGTIFAAVGKVIYPYYLTKGQPKIHLIIVLVSFIINFILNIILIPIFKINGAAFASTFSYVIYAIIYIIYSSYKEQFSIKKMFVFDYEDKDRLRRFLK